MKEVSYIYDAGNLQKGLGNQLDALTTLRHQLEDYNSKQKNGQKVNFTFPVREIDN